MVFILNSAPGVGKTTALRLLQEKLTEDFSFLDGDDVGRIVPLENTIEWLNMIQDNIVSCCVNFRLYGKRNSVIGFVFPSGERIGRLKALLEKAGFHVCHITIFCDDEEIEKRIRKRNTSKLISIDKAKELNERIRQLDSDFRINTTELDNDETTNEILNFILQCIS